MKSVEFAGRVLILGLLLCGWMFEAAAGPFQLISARDPAQAPPAGGSGDSWGPLISADGRFVLFSSTANNLVSIASNTPMAAGLPALLNVFLRDRSNAITQLISVSTNGTDGGNNDSIAAGVSSDGRYALFESAASNLLPGDTNNVTDIFLRDTLMGTTALVSTRTNGGVGNGMSRDATMTPDGRFIAFVSAANNLFPGDTNRIPDVFVRDMVGGVTTRASAGAISTDPFFKTSASEAPEITPDGRFVAFQSTATNLVPAVGSVGELYVRDLTGGVTYWASAAARGTLFARLGTSNAISYNHALSADGNYVAYETSRAPGSSPSYPGLILRYSIPSGATDLVHTNARTPPGLYDVSDVSISSNGQFVAFIANTNNVLGDTTCVRLWDALTGNATLASGDLSNRVASGTICDWPVLDPSGRYLAFNSSATNLTTNTLTGFFHLYLRDTFTGAITLLDQDTNGTGVGVSAATVPHLNNDAQWVAFDCADSSLVADDRNHDVDVFVHAVNSPYAELISQRDPSLSARVGNGSGFIGAASLSRDGRFAAFASDGDNFVAGDTNGVSDVFLRDLATGSNALVSLAANGGCGNAPSYGAALSGDGRWLAFTSYATNLVVGDTNHARDVFVRDLQTQTTLLASRDATGGGQGNGDSYDPMLSTDGHWVLFRSRATNLAAGSYTSGSENLFERDLQAGTNIALTQGGVIASVMTPDGSFVAMIGRPWPATSTNLYLWDNRSGRFVYTNSGVSLSNLALSPDGNRLAWSTGTVSAALLMYDRMANTTTALGSLPLGSRAAPRFSGDNRWLVYGRASPGISNQVYLYDIQNGAERLVSHAFGLSTAAAGPSDSMDLSYDGRFVVYRSAATNLLSVDTNGVPDIFLYDRQSGGNVLLSANALGLPVANRSLSATFNGDGQTILFQTWAADLVMGDFNHSGDLVSWTLLSVAILPGATSADRWLTWPVVPGNTYRVEFKNQLSDPAWQALPVSVTNAGVKAWAEDSGTISPTRFYRIMQQGN